MTEDEFLYQMACDFGHKTYSELGDVDYKLYENIEGKDIAKYFAEKLAARDVEIQKQIEAVRGLIEAHKNLAYSKSIVNLSLLQSVKDTGEGLRTLTETLKPHLNGEKLEV